MIELLEILGIDVEGYNALAPEFNPPGWGYILVFVLVCGVVGWWAAGATRLLDSRPRKTVITVLRIMALLLLIFIMLDPAVVLQKRSPIRPRLAVLWDTSRSMSLSSGRKASTRIDEAREWWQEADSLRRHLEKNYRTEIWAFSDVAAPLGPEAFTSGPEDEPQGDRTDILAALKRVAQSSGDAPAGVILISDGADNSALAEIAARDKGIETTFREYPGPVFVVPLGEGGKHKDVGIEKIEVPEYGFVRNAVEVKLTISARGFEGTDVPITVFEGKRVVTTKSIRLDKDEGSWSIDLAFAPDQVGDFLYTIELPKFGGEAVYDNNSRVFSLKVLRDKIRVLQVVGRPSWDTRFLREALKNDPTIELISFYILRQPMDMPMAHSDELSLIPFPTDELYDTKIRTFDLIIMQDFSWIPYLRPAYLANIRDFVTDFGGGFVMIGGPLSFTGGHYALTPLEDILPVHLVTDGALYQEGEYRPRLTEAGSRHPITAMETSPNETRKLWDSLPPIEGFNVVGHAKSGATVLLEHPFQSAGDQNMPLMAVWSAGRGKVMTLATDTSYRWRLDRMVEGQAADEYLRMWRAAVRWLVGDPEGKRVRVRTGRTSYSPGQTISLRIKVLDLDWAPAPQARIEATLEGAGKPKKVEGFIPDGEEIIAELKNPGPGGWTIKVEAFDDQDQSLGKDEAVFVVERRGREFSPPWPNPGLLEKIAKATGGQVWRSDKSPDTGKLKKPSAWRIVGRRRLPLWDNWIAGALLLLILAAEWYLRRRWGLN